MGKRLVMGPDLGPDDPATINLDLAFVGGPGLTTRHDDNGFASTNPFDTVSIFGLVYIVNTPANLAALTGVDFNDELVGTNGDDLIVWEARRTGISFPDYYILPTGGVAAIDNFLLGAGNDVLNLTYTFDNIAGTPDTPYTDNANIDGGTGDDVVWSGLGNDVISGGGGGGGSEILYGGGGNDLIVGSSGAFNNISGDSGNDELYGGSSRDAIAGGSDDDTAFGGSDIDLVDGEAGNDTIFGGSGADDVYGGSGNDTVSGDGDADDIDGGTGYLDTLYGGTGNDIITDPDGAKYAFGNSENDIIQIGYDAGWNQGVASLYGGSGNDTISATGALNSAIGLVVRTDEVSGVGDGDDIVSLRNSYTASTVFLGGGSDVFGYLPFGSSNGARTDTVYGGAGADTIASGIGIDVLFGDAGDDSLEGGLDADTMYGGSEVDFISYASSAGAVTMGLTGGVGIGGDAQGDVAWTDIENLTGSATQSDSLYGNASTNTILGLGGDDTIEGLGGGDSLDGGAGVNWLSYANSDQGVIINFLAGTGTGGHANGDTVANFQNLIGSAHNDVLTGSAATNVIQGGAGIDTIEGGGSADTLYGGGNGDFLSYAGSTAVSVSLLAGSGTGGDAASDVFSGFQHLIGSAQGDTLTGDAQSNSIVGGAGVDTVEGGAGGDALFGGGGNDYVVGDDLDGGISGAADFLYGGQGDDTINGGIGGDSMYGGAGIDSFDGGDGDDTIFDSDGASFISGGLGSDMISVFFNNPAIVGGDGDGDGDGGTPIVIYGGNNDITEGADGNDRVFVSGTYNEINAGLGAGDDTYISARLGAGSLRDFVDGGPGGDVISTWSGDDIIDSGSGGDALWGGAGVDTIMGGADGDILYGGDGDGDLLVGGDGSDYYYWARTDGDDRIEDRDTVAGGEGENYIVVIPDFDPLTDLPRVGSGVLETDHDLYDNAGGDDMVQITLDPGGDGSTQYIMTILQGPGAGSQLYFDSDEISVIGLWNNDATGSTPVITAYYWDPMDSRYEYRP